VFAIPISDSRRLVTSAASAARAAGELPAPDDMPCRVRSRTRRAWPSVLVSVPSSVPSQPRPSSALREYCSAALTSPRSCIAEIVPVGESDGRLICLPLDSCSCNVAILDRLV
jgi:hypothetical protein